MAGILANKRIFMVEDNLGNRTIAQAFLEAEGAKFAFERWGKNTVAAALAFLPIDIVLMDLMFPEGISGYDIFEEFKKHPQLVSIPVVIVTASDPTAEMPKARSLGFAGLISKPLRIDRFPKQVAAAISGEKIWSAG